MSKLEKMLVLGMMCTMLGCTSVGGAADNSVTIMNSANDKKINVQKLVKSLQDYDVVFFGEYHDQSILHRLEFDVLQKMYALHGDKLVLSLEMFETDNQEHLNKYLAGELSEEKFLKNSRPWPNYKEDYRPLIEFAKEHGIPVLAANVPRFLAANMAKYENLDKVEKEYKQFLPQKTYAPEGAYKEKFTAYMLQGSSMRFPKERLHAVFAAQCLKDDKMAESMYYYLSQNKEKVVLHINGSFHSDAHLGTVEKLETLDPKLRTAVITPKEMPADKNYLLSYSKDKKDGDYVIYFVRTVKEKSAK